MATVGLYGSSSSGVVASASGSESTGLYGNNVSFGGSYFEWFIFTQADTQPATPTGGSWDFTTNAGTPPAGWSAVPPSAPTNKVWVSIALVNSKNTGDLVWSAPGLFSYASGLPILSGNGTPSSGLGVTDQLYIQLDAAPQAIWFKESGTWTRLTGSSLYVDLTSNQTIAGIKTFNSTIEGSISGTASNVTGVVGISNGGTGSTTASGARTALGAAASGANSDITSLAGITGGISTADYVQFDTTYATPLGVGQIGWDGNNTLGLGMAGGNVVQKIGEDLFYYIKASSAITKGQVVMFTGAVGASGVVTGAPATGVSDGSYIMGIAAESIALNGFGLVQFQGTLKGFDTSAFSNGAVLWYDPAVTGGLTATKPSAPNIKVQMAAVINSGSGGSGSVLIRVTPGSVLGGTDSNVLFGTLSNNDMIKYNSAAGYWQNVAGPAGAIVGTTDTQTLTNKTISGANNTLTNIGNSSLTNSSITINGNAVNLGGSTTITANTTQTLTRGAYLTGNNFNGSVATTWAVDADSANTASKVVVRDASGNFAAGTITATSFSGPLTGTVGATTPSTGAFTTLTASSDSSFTSTGALTISKGTTAQQPASPVTGMIRYNTTTNQFEGYAGSTPSWLPVGGSVLSNDTTTATNVYPLFANATSGTATTIYTSNANLLYKPSTGELQAQAMVSANGLTVNSATVSVNYTLSSGNNAVSAGPISVASGITVTVSSGSVWTVV